jgi:hypothetical protein
MMHVTRQARLSAAELVLLDGRCSHDAQAIVDAAKTQIRIERERGLLEAHAAFIADAIAYARKDLALGFQTLSIQRCTLCGKNAGYVPHERNGRNHKKGDPDTKRPNWMSGVDLADRCKTGAKTFPELGCCNDCWEPIRSALLDELKALRVELPESLTGHWRWFIRSHATICTACGWKGHRQQCRFSDDFKSIGCPNCGVMNELFKTRVEQDFKAKERYVIVDVRRLRFGIVDEFGSQSTPYTKKLRMRDECMARLHDVPRSIYLEWLRINGDWQTWNSEKDAERGPAYERDMAQARADWEVLKAEERAQSNRGAA